MIGLGLRLALAGGRGAIIGLTLTALAVALGTSILLFALSFAPALQDRQDRSAWRVPAVFLDEVPAGTGSLMQAIDDRFMGEALLRVRIAPLGPDAPIPPGLARMPSPGEAFVSPTLAARMAALPSDQLADRIGDVVGIIQPEALRSPQELVAVIGAEAATLRADGALVRASAVPLPDVSLALVLAGSILGALLVVGLMLPAIERLTRPDGVRLE